METKRPTVPAAEEILGLYHPVLDHGWLALVDYMGTDDDVERAARVSYGYGTRKRSRTRGLIRYLRRHRHTTPSEMVELKFHCVMPIFVARQWVRHRTACLAEGTEVYFDLPGGIERRGNQLYKLRIEEIWKRFQPTRNRTRPDKQRNPYYKRDRVRQMHLRQMDEDTGRIRHTRLVDIYRNGPKPVFRMTLADGKQIECTSDHRFLFADGWRTLRDAVGLRRVGQKAVWDAGEHFVYANGLVREKPALYRDRDWLARQYREEGRTAGEIADLLGVSEPTIRTWLKKLRIRAPRERRGFSEGHVPWNKGKTYRLGPRELSDAWIRANRDARSGEASNFWKGGTADDRASIGRWTTQAAPRVHRRDNWTCQICGRRATELQCHHIVPVWADAELARDEDNLTTLCVACHDEVTRNELEYVERLQGPPLSAKARREPRPRVPWNKLTYGKLVAVESFEFVGTKETYDLEVEGPYHNFVANGIVTHNSLNEYSGRYSLMPLLFYTPEEDDFALQSQANRQGRQEAPPDPELYRETIRRWDALREEAAGAYGWLVAEDVARELARIDLPLSTYTQWYWKIDLHNLFHFLSLRADPHAQLEIRRYAEVMAGMMKRVAPLSFEAWVDYEFTGVHLSHGELQALRNLIRVQGEEDAAGASEAGDDASQPTDGAEAARGAEAAAGGGDAEPLLRARENAPGLDEEALRELGLSGREIRELVEKLRPRDRPDFELDMKRLVPAEEVAAEMEEHVPEPEA